MECPNTSLESWKELEASVGTQRAYYLWNKYGGNVPQEEYNQDVSVDLVPEIQELNNFVLFEDRDKLCAGGICNLTAAKSTEILEKAGLNPFPNPYSYGGDSLPVTVKSPLGDFFITHYVAASAINGSIYIYDMPQNEFISDKDFGMGNVSLKTAFKPRLIPLTIDSIKANYNLNSQDAAKFIRSVLNRQATNVHPTFRSYIQKNIKNSEEYIKSLEDQISSEGVMLDSREEYKLKEESLKELKDKQREVKLSRPLTDKEENKVINFLRNKLKLKVREYLPTKSTSFTLGNIIKSVTGLHFDYSRESIDAALEKFKTYTESDQFLSDIWDRYSFAKSNLDKMNQSLDELFSFKRLLDGFFKLAKTEGIENALSRYDSKQQHKLRTFLPRDILTKYKSNKQAVFMLERTYSNINVIIKHLNINFGRPLTELMKDKVKLNAQFEKANTVLNYLKAVDFDASYIYESIANEAKRRYVYFEKQGNLSFQIESMPASKASEETLNKVKEAAKKMGISIQDLADYAKSNPAIDTKSATGVADLVRGVIAVAEGREDVALTEEMVHLATAILEQTNPKLVTEMVSKIDRFKVYQQTLEAYKNNKAYQLPNGKPDIRKIKKEAVDKLIAELIINQSEGSTEFPELMEEANRSIIRRWWNTITDFLRGMYKKSNISIFEEAAATISEGEVGGTVADIEGEGVFFQLSDAQKNTIDKIKAQQANIEKIIEKKESDPLLLDSEEANNYYRIKLPDGTYIEKSQIKRVTDRVKAWYKRRFGDKEFTEAEKKFNNLKREFGIKYHGYFEEIYDRYFNSDGTRRSTPGARPSITDPVDDDVYHKLEQYFTELINLPELKDAAILSEVMIFDPVQKEAGTIDLLAIDKNGKAHILDWKFMYISDETKTDDVAWFKQGAYNIQLGRYKEILKDSYGVKEFGMLRAIPFLMRFQRQNPKDSKSPMILKGITTGSADKSKIQSLKLMPVAEQTESTGYDELDGLIKKLNALLKQYSAEKVTDETEREFKIERLNTIRRAIRIVQGSQNIAPLIDVIEVMRKDGEKILEDYETTYKNRPATRDDFKNKELSEFSEEMNNYIKFSDIFSSIGDYIGDLIFTEQMLAEAKTKEEKEYANQMKDVLSKLENEQKLIRKTKNKIVTAASNFADKHIGERNLVTGLTRPEAVIQGLSSWFRGVSELPMASLKVLYKLVTLAKGRASAEALGEVEELMKIREKIASSGRNLRQTVKQLYQSDSEGKFVNKLIYKYKKEFFDLVKQKKEEGGDKKWLLDNIDVEEYKKEAEAKLKENIDKISKRRYPGTKEEERETREDLILQEKKRWDISRKDFNGWDNYILKRHPKDIWLSEEYKGIQKDSDLLSLYNFITKFNQKAKDVGYIENKIASTFLPFIRKTMAEQLVWNNTLSVVQNFGNSLTINPDDVGYGKFNEITGELENSIPKYYTTDFTKKGDGVNDYSDVSEDLFKNLILYVQHVNKYKYMSEIEGQLKLVKTIEEFKGHINTNRVGKVLLGDTGPEIIASNVENTKTFDTFLRALLYEQKYALSDADTPLNFGKALNGVKKIFNKVAGKEIWSENENPSATSLIKTMDAANRAFQLKTLGLNPISGAVNAFGANIQMSTQAGRYFKSREFLKNEIKLMGMRFNSEEERQIFAQSVDLFMPLKDDPSYELYKKAGMSVATRRSVADDLMFFMRYPEQLVEKSVFETLMENMMVENGRIISIHEFVKNKYRGRTKEAGMYRETKSKIEQEIEELKNTKSIAKTRKLENGKLVIPGLDLNNREELQRLTNLTRTISRNATGSLSDGDINRMSMSIWTKSMMIFRNWIPKLADTRFSEFRKVSDDFSVTVNDQGEIEGERYDIGRLRLLGHVFMNSLSSASNNVYNILVMNEKGVAEIDKMYEEFAKKFEEQTGQKMTMDRDEFADMIRTNLRNQIKELIILGTLVGTMFSLGFFEPDDDEDKATKNAFRYTQRVVDKFVSELSFFYNPANFEQLLSGSAFPSIGLIADFYKVMSNFLMEITGYDFTNPTKTPEEIRKKALPIKRVVNMVPAGKSIMTWIAMIDSEFAKEFDITVQKETSVR